MFNWLNKFRCQHDWHKTLDATETTTEYTEGEINVIEREVVYIYCPHCRRRKRISPKMWEIIEQEQKILQNEKVDFVNA